MCTIYFMCIHLPACHLTTPRTLAPPPNFMFSLFKTKQSNKKQNKTDKQTKTLVLIRVVFICLALGHPVINKLLTRDHTSDQLATYNYLTSNHKFGTTFCKYNTSMRSLYKACTELFGSVLVCVPSCHRS